MKSKCASCRYSRYSFAVKSFVCYLNSQEPKIVYEHHCCFAFSDVIDNEEK